MKRQSNETILKFRNYQPSTIPTNTQPTPSSPTQSSPEPIETIETQVHEFIKETTIENPPVQDEELDLASLAPKKPNWDLKRDLNIKMKQLENNTLVAISDLVRERLIQNQDLANAAEIQM